MKIKPTKTMRAFIRDLQAQADRLSMDVDWDTLTLVPISGYPRTWPEGDRTSWDYEGGKED